MIQPSDLDKLRAKTAKTPEDFRVLAQAQGLSDPDALRHWLQAEFGLAGEYARRIVQLLHQLDGYAIPGHDSLLNQAPGKEEKDAAQGYLPLISQRHAGE